VTGNIILLVINSAGYDSTQSPRGPAKWPEAFCSILSAVASLAEARIWRQVAVRDQLNPLLSKYIPGGGQGKDPKFRLARRAQTSLAKLEV
jgi:hypothetical protein